MMNRAKCLLSVVLVGCGSSATKTSTIKVGAVVPVFPPIAQALVQASFDDVAAGMAQAKDLKGLAFEVSYKESDIESAPPALAAAAEFRSAGVQVILADAYISDVAINSRNYVDDKLGVPIVCPACISNDINNPEVTNSDPLVQATMRDADRWNFVPVARVGDEEVALARVLASKGNAGDTNADGVLKISVLTTDFISTLPELENALKALRPAVKFEYVFLPGGMDPTQLDWPKTLRDLTDNVNSTTNVTDGAPDAIVQSLYFDYMPYFLAAYAEARPQVPVFSGSFSRLLIADYGGASDVVLAGLEGMEGVSFPLVENNDRGRFFTENVGGRVANLPPSIMAGQFYDSGILIGLASRIAIESLSDGATPTPVEIRDALRKVSDSAGEPIGPGPDEFARAVKLISEGKAINYQGVSGDCDFDVAHQRAKSKFVRWRIENKAFKEYERYDCRKSGCPADE